MAWPLLRIGWKEGNRMEWLRHLWLYRKQIAIVAVVVIAATGMYLSMAFALTRSAGYVFNQVMARQHLVKGSVHVDSLAAHLNGHVDFENLEWDDDDGNPLLVVPSGQFKLRMWDVIRGKIKASTIRELTLEKATIVMDMDDTMQVDFVKGSSDLNKPVTQVHRHSPRKTTVERQKEMEERIRNFDWHGQFINTKINLIHCQLELFQKQRHFVLHDVNAMVRINSKKRLYLDFSTGEFGGTAIGKSVHIKGSIDLPNKSDSLPTMKMDFNAYEVDPGSLGFGDVHDAMTLQSHITGPISHPVATGHLTMPILRIPALTFTNVTGDVAYEDGLLTFTNVSANVYEGRLQAHGTYHIDTRAYTIEGDATNLNSSLALHDDDFEVLVDAHLELDSQGHRRDTHASGTFVSKPGRYIMMPIEKISGSFNNVYKKLDFYNVVIKTPAGEITTDAFHIINGKLHMNHLNILTANGGSLHFDEDNLYRDKVAINRAREGTETVAPNVASIKSNVNDMKDGKEEISDLLHGVKDLGSSFKRINETIRGFQNQVETW